MGYQTYDSRDLSEVPRHADLPPQPHVEPHLGERKGHPDPPSSGVEVLFGEFTVLEEQYGRVMTHDNREFTLFWKYDGLKNATREEVQSGQGVAFIERKEQKNRGYKKVWRPLIQEAVLLGGDARASSGACLWDVPNELPAAETKRIPVRYTEDGARKFFNPAKQRRQSAPPPSPALARQQRPPLSADARSYVPAAAGWALQPCTPPGLVARDEVVGAPRRSPAGGVGNSPPGISPPGANNPGVIGEPRKMPLPRGAAPTAGAWGHFSGGPTLFDGLPAAAPVKSAAQDWVRGWLVSHGCGEYVDTCMRMGYDSPMAFERLSNEELVSLGVRKPGHQKIFRKLWDEAAGQMREL